MRPAEKVNQEVAIMKFVREKTKIPIPEFIACSTAKGHFAGLGPFIIMEFIEGERLDEVLYKDDKIKPGVEQSTLNFIYKQIAQIYLELDSHDFNQIGGLSILSNDRFWYTESAPLTLKINEGQRMTGLDLYGKTFYSTPA
jgi:aminoglycoside phosphotransferase (APT) family kinase protein